MFCVFSHFLVFIFRPLLCTTQIICTHFVRRVSLCVEKGSLIECNTRREKKDIEKDTDTQKNFNTHMMDEEEGCFVSRVDFI